LSELGKRGLDKSELDKSERSELEKIAKLKRA